VYPEKKSKQIQKNNNLRKKGLKTNIPQNAKLDYPRAATPFFDGHQFACAFLQKAPSSFTCVQEL
jgi:hypothetical protein